MDNNKKEIFLNGVAENVKEEEIVLASPEDMIDEAREIAQNTRSDEKYPFTLYYDANHRDFLLSMLQTVGAIVESHDEAGHTLSTVMNMTQLAFVKRLHCVERVKSNENTNPFLTGEAERPSLEWLEQQSEDVVAGEPAMANTMIENNTVAANANRATAVSVIGDHSSMETAKEIRDESVTIGCISCPCAEQWFKFTATQSCKYTICTLESLDTIGTLYDSNGNRIAEVDDYEPCGKVGFRIIRPLTSGSTYYIKVRLYGRATGIYSLKVTSKVLANFTSISRSAATLDIGVRYELPLTPNYNYKGYSGAQPIPGLSVQILPTNTDDQKILWGKFGTILDIQDGLDNDGERYIHVIANGGGNAKLYAVDWQEYGKRDECAVIVDPRERVVVKRDGDFNKIVFQSSGKEWLCVNYDLINDPDNLFGKKYDNTYETLRDRMYANTYETVNEFEGIVSWRDPKSYTDNEMKLLYMLDPHGFAAYVQEYCYHVYDTAGSVNYKDGVFELLFNKSPKYFARRDKDGEWEDVTTRKEEYGILQVMSESELFFGTHPVYDVRFGIQCFKIIVQIITMPVAFASLASLHVPAAYETFLKYANLSYTLTKALVEEDYKTYVESLINAAKDELDSGEETKSENYNMDWAKSLFELSDSFEELEQIVRDRPTYYKEIFNFCAADSNYRIFFEYNNGTIEEVSDISDKLS